VLNKTKRRKKMFKCEHGRPPRDRRDFIEDFVLSVASSGRSVFLADSVKSAVRAWDEIEKAASLER
jgi:hypothetical protein